MSQPDPESYFYLYRISYAWYALIGFLVTMAVGLVTSLVCEKIGLCQPQEESKLDPDLFVEWVRRDMLEKREEEGDGKNVVEMGDQKAKETSGLIDKS